MKLKLIPAFSVLLIGAVVAVGLLYLTNYELNKKRDDAFQAIYKRHFSQLQVNLSNLEKEAEFIIHLAQEKPKDLELLLGGDLSPWQGDWHLAEPWGPKQLKRQWRKEKAGKADFKLHPKMEPPQEQGTVIQWSLKDKKLDGLDLLQIARLASLLESLSLEGEKKLIWPSSDRKAWQEGNLILISKLEKSGQVLLGRFPLAKLWEGSPAINGLVDQGMDVRIQGQEVLLPYGETVWPAAMVYEESLSLFGRKLQVTYRTLLSFEQESSRLLPTAYSGVTLILTLLLFMVMMNLARKRANLEDELEASIKLGELYEESLDEGYQSNEVKALVQDCLRRICQYSGWKIGHAFVPDEQREGEAADVWFFDEELKGGNFKENFESKNFMTGETLTDRVLVHQSFVWIPNMEQDSSFTKSKMNMNLGVSCAIGVPLVIDEEILMVLEFFGPIIQECDELLMERVTRLVGHLSGLLEARWARGRVAQAMGRAKGLLDHINQSVFLMDQGGKLLMMNNAAESHFGYKFSDIRSRGFEIFLPEPDHSKYKHFFENYQNNPKSQTFDGTKELFGKRKDGSQIPIKMLLQEIQIGNQINLMVVITHMDKDQKSLSPTERLALKGTPDDGAGRMELEPKKSLAGKNLSSLEPIKAIHERTTELSRSLKGKNLQAVEEIKVQAEAIEDVMQGLYSLSRMQDGSGKLSRLPFNLGELVDQTMGRIAPRAYVKELELISYIEPDVPLDLVGDREKLSNLISLLVDNGIRYAQKGQILFEIKARLVEHSQVQLAFMVRDSGPGMSAEEAHMIGLQLRQDDRNIKREEKRLGLSLTYAKELANLLEGQVEITSQPGQWTLVTVSLTLGRKSKSVKAVTLEKTLGGNRLLIIDPDEIQGKSIQNRLAYRGGKAQSYAELNDAMQELHNAQNIGQPYQWVILNASQSKNMTDKVFRELGLLDEEVKPRVILLHWLQEEALEGMDYPTELIVQLEKPLKLEEPFLTIKGLLDADS